MNPMKNSIIATLMALLVFPGAGHLWLKKKTRGWCIISISLIVLCLVMNEVFTIAWEVVEAINYGHLPMMNSQELSLLVTEKLAEKPNTQLYYYSGALVFLWLGSAIDALRIGLKH
jgi:hypothetical protein